MVAQRFDAGAFLIQARGDGFAAHLGARACVVQGRDLFFQRRLKRAHALKGDIQSGVEAVQFPAHRARQPGGIAGGDFVGGEQLLAGGKQGAGGIRHRHAARQHHRHA